MDPSLHDCVEPLDFLVDGLALIGVNEPAPSICRQGKVYMVVGGRLERSIHPWICPSR